MTAINAEERTREALEWALEHTCLAIPPGYRTAAFWQWNGDDVQLQATTADGDFRFHVAAERRRGVKTRIAILSWKDDQGTATWEAEMPNEGRRAVRAALEAVMPEREPAAYIIWRPGLGYRVELVGRPGAERLAGDDGTITPLYEHPAPEPGEVDRLREEAAAHERSLWVEAIETYFDATAVHDVEGYVSRARAALAEGGGE